MKRKEILGAVPPTEGRLKTLPDTALPVSGAPGSMMHFSDIMLWGLLAIGLLST